MDQVPFISGPFSCRVCPNKVCNPPRLLRPVCLINADGVDRKASGISVTNTYPAPFTQDLPEGRLARPHCSIRGGLCSVPTHFLNIYYCYCCYWTQNLTTHSSSQSMNLCKNDDDSHTTTITTSTILSDSSSLSFQV